MPTHPIGNMGRDNERDWSFRPQQGTRSRGSDQDSAQRISRTRLFTGPPRSRSRDVAACLQGIAKTRGNVTADRARSVLSAMFAWAIGEGLADENPVIGTNRRSDDEPRTRVLSDAEIVKLWNGLPDTQYGVIVKLLALTGCRRDEMGALSWKEIDFEGRKITLPAERTKNGTEHIVPLSDLALNILETQKRILSRPFVFGWDANGFTDWSKSKEKLNTGVEFEK